MRILLTNDDGVHAPGLAVLERIARTLSDDVTVVAPAEEQSGAGHSLTLTRPVRLRQLDDRRFAVTGTPTDAVLLGLGVVMKERKPDLILSGVNRGANLGDDITYSGTVSATMEGTLAGIRSIALSQVYTREGMGDGVRFDAAETWGARVLAAVVASSWTPKTLVNVNFPALPADKVRGVRVTRQGFHDYARSRVEKRTDPRGFDYYWFGLAAAEHTPGHDSDLEAVGDGYVSVTPLHLDLTHDPSRAALEAAFR